MNFFIAHTTHILDEEREKKKNWQSQAIVNYPTSDK